VTAASRPIADSARLFLTAVAGISAAALVVTVLGVTSAARAWLGLEPLEPPADPRRALAIFVFNFRLAAAAVGAALAVRWLPSLRVGLDVALGALAILNMALVGVALGAYGFPLLGRVGIHATLEVAAFSVAGSSYLAARDGRLTRLRLYTTVGIACVLLAAGALVETYAEIGTGP
jgi:hypothetical protein